MVHWAMSLCDSEVTNCKCLPPRSEYWRKKRLGDLLALRLKTLAGRFGSRPSVPDCEAQVKGCKPPEPLAATQTISLCTSLLPLRSGRL